MPPTHDNVSDAWSSMERSSDIKSGSKLPGVCVCDVVLVKDYIFPSLLSLEWGRAH